MPAQSTKTRAKYLDFLQFLLLYHSHNFQCTFIANCSMLQRYYDPCRLSQIMCFLTYFHVSFHAYILGYVMLSQG